MDKAPLDEEGIQQAEARVQEWRVQRAMHLLEFPPETIARLRGSLD